MGSLPKKLEASGSKGSPSPSYVSIVLGPNDTASGTGPAGRCSQQRSRACALGSCPVSLAEPWARSGESGSSQRAWLSLGRGQGERGSHPARATRAAPSHP